MKTFIRQNAFFLLPYSILFIGFAVLIACTDKAQLHLQLNSFHNDFWDPFFKYVTKSGEVLPYIIAIALLFHKVGYGLFLLLGQLGAGLCTQILKHIFNEPRPRLYFAEHLPDVSLPLVDGVTVRNHFSFPSGHTTAMFALFFSLCIITKNKWAKFFFLICACLGGFSRIYLSQHFAIDVLWGSIIGTLGICAFYYSKFPLEKSWSNRPIQSFFKKK